MYKHLHLAVEDAKAFDNRPDKQRYSAVLVGEIIERKPISRLLTQELFAKYFEING